MPAHKKPVALHKLHNTYRPCRHDERTAKATATGERAIPEWLPENVKPVYSLLMQCLPPLDAVDETPLAQLATLKTRLQEDPDSMTSAQHGQLRQLAGTIREWVKDYQSMTDEPVLDEYEQWQARRNQRQKTEPLPEVDSQGRKRIPLPRNLKTLKNSDTCTNEPG